MQPNRRAWSLVCLLVVLSLVAASCGGDDDEATGSRDDESDSSADVDPDGVLRMGATLLPGTSFVQFDPATLVTPAVLPHQLLYDNLLRAQVDGSYEPGLATKAEVIDPSTIKVELRSGVKFSDGTTLDAEAVKFNLERMAAANNPGAIAAEMKQLDVVTVDGPLSLTIKLKTPIAGIFYVYLSRGETMVVSPTAVKSGADTKAKPAGAGPYLLESLTIENKIVLVKNPDFFQAERVRIPRVEFVHVASPEAIQNALRTDVIDAMDGAAVTPDLVSELDGSGIKSAEKVTSSTLFWGQICKSRPPLDNLKVRQALNYGLDREALDQLLYDGKSEPMWGFWPKGSKFHDPDLDDFYKRDVAKAKRLLAEGGYPNGFELELIVPNTGGLGVTGTEIVQAQWADIGVRVKIIQSANMVQEFFLENKYPGQFFTLQRNGLDRVTRNLVPGSIGNICNWNHPGLNDLVAKLRAVAQDSDEAVELWHQLDRLALEEAMNIFGVFGTTANLWNPKRIGGVAFTPNFQGIPHLDVLSVYVRK